MLKFSVISIFPQMVQSYFQEGLVGQALKKNLFAVELINPREFTKDNHKTVDDRPFGGGDGMVMLAEVLAATVESIKAREPQTHVIYLSAQGKPWTAQAAEALARRKHVTLISGRYGGIDQRVINQIVDEEVSIGDYVLSGGELAALTVIDSTARFIDGVLGNKASAQQDSFSRDGLEAPMFTRPEVWRDEKVPAILLGGHHQKIEAWRDQVGQVLTLHKRPELAAQWSPEKIADLKKFWQNLSTDEKQVCGLPLEWSYRG